LRAVGALPRDTSIVRLRTVMLENGTVEGRRSARVRKSVREDVVASWGPTKGGPSAADMRSGVLHRVIALLVGGRGIREAKIHTGHACIACCAGLRGAALEPGQGLACSDMGCLAPRRQRPARVRAMPSPPKWVVAMAATRKAAQGK
jgi:hypothetical protein